MSLLAKINTRTPSFLRGIILYKSQFSNPSFSQKVILEENKLLYPVIVKPTRMEASVGVHLVHNDDDMKEALKVVFSLGDSAIIDEFIEGREMRTGVLSRHNSILESLPMIEYTIPHDDIRGMNMKIAKDGKTLVKSDFKVLYENDEPELYEAMYKVAVNSHMALDCRDFSFIDCRVTASGDIYVLEINVFAAFNPGSVMTKLTNAAGISHQEFWGSMLKQALARKSSRSKICGA